MEKQAVILYAVNNGYLSDIPVEKIGEFEKRFYDYMEVQGKDVMSTIRTTKEIAEDTEDKLKTAIVQFKQTFTK